MKFILNISFLLLVHTCAFSQWQQTSGPSGGGVSEFAFVNGNILAATFDLGNGVFVSTDNGTSWHASGLQGIMLTHITAHDNTVITSSTQNSYNETDTIYRSSDGGSSWQKVTIDGAAGTIPNINGIVSICYHNHGWFLTTQGQNGRMYSSQDDGLTWTSFRPAFNFSHPVILVSAGLNLMAGTTNNGHIDVYRSTDGSTWIESNSNIDTTFASEIYAGAISGNSIFFGISGGVIYSKDGGVSWSQPPVPGIRSREEYIDHIAGLGNTIVFVSSQNNIFVSHNGGDTVTKVTGNGLPSNASYFFSVAADDQHQEFYLGLSSGVMNQSLLSNQWLYKTDGLAAQDVTEVATNGGLIFAASERGVSYSPDGGSSWHDPRNPLDLLDIPINGFLTASSNFFAYGAGLYSWNGTTWNTVDTSGVTALAEGGSGTLFACRQSPDPISGNSGIDMSTTGGASWNTTLSFANSIDTEMYFPPHCISSDGGSNIVAVQRAIIFENFTSVYIVYRSIDNGATWQQSGTVNSPAFVSFTGNAFYMGTYGKGLYRSFDNGVTWTRFPGMADGADITSFLKISNIFLISVTGNGNMTDGLYFSTNDGASWRYANNGTANIFGPLATDGSFLYSSGPGVWRRTLNGLSVNDPGKAPENISLELYPNPATEVIHLHINTPKHIEGTLTIYDEKGMAVTKQEISSDPGTNDLPISITGISEGAYYAKLTDGNGVAIGAARFVVQRK